VRAGRFLPAYGIQPGRPYRAHPRAPASTSYDQVYAIERAARDSTLWRSRAGRDARESLIHGNASHTFTAVGGTSGSWAAGGCWRLGALSRQLDAQPAQRVRALVFGFAPTRT